MQTIFLKPDFIIFILAFGLTACSKDGEIIYLFRFPEPPVVVTYAPENVTMATANLGGSILSKGSGSVTESGIYIYVSGVSSAPDPAPVAEFIERRYSESTTEGDFSVFLRDLTANTVYHYRAFATNHAGTSYGDMKILVTSCGVIADEEVNVYQTIKIGEQNWMRENLRSTKYSDGTDIQGYYDQVDDYIFGKHYTWQAATKAYNETASVCPVGWHIPSDAEWQKLLKYIGVPSSQLNSFGIIGNDQAIMLKESGSDHWENAGITNSTGFSILPAGVCSGDGKITCTMTAFWTSTPYIFYSFQNDSEKIIRGNHPSGKCRFSIRCIKD